jgi:hypothetical protein
LSDARDLLIASEQLILEAVRGRGRAQRRVATPTRQSPLRNDAGSERRSAPRLDPDRAEGEQREIPERPGPSIGSVAT